MTSPVDCLIIGGGPAGLTTALTLARQLHTCIVFDSSDYRNDASHHMHMTPTWDHKDPADFRAASRKNILEKYKTIEFKDIKVNSVARNEKGLFEVTDSNSKTWIGRKLVLATGVQDIYPDIPGYVECWGTGIYHCLFCHGYEERDAPSSGLLAVGILEQPPFALHVARNARQLTPSKVTIYTNGNESVYNAIKEAVAPQPAMEVDDRPIASFEQGSGKAKVIIHFKDGSKAAEAFVAHAPKTKPKGPFIDQLGLDLSPSGDIAVNPPYNTASVPGVFAAGDTSTPMKMTNFGLYSGCLVGNGVATQLQTEGPVRTI